MLVLTSTENPTVMLPSKVFIISFLVIIFPTLLNAACLLECTPFFDSSQHPICSLTENKAFSSQCSVYLSIQNPNSIFWLTKTITLNVNLTDRIVLLYITGSSISNFAVNFNFERTHPNIRILKLQRVRLVNPENAILPLINLQRLTLHYTELSDVSFFEKIPKTNSIYFCDLDYNKISSLAGSNFQNLEKLNTLGFYLNKISDVSRKDFVGLNKLTFLNLAGNSLKVIWDDAFRELNSLRRINFDENPLISLNYRAFEHLAYLYRLKTPPIHCDCSVQWISIIAYEFNTYVNPYSRCASPVRHRGKQVRDPSIYTNCTVQQSFQCFNKSRNPCYDGSFCVGTSDGFECVCEGERMAYSQSLGKCFDIEKMIQMTKDCYNGAVFDENKNDVVCKTGCDPKQPNRFP